MVGAELAGLHQELQAPGTGVEHRARVGAVHPEQAHDTVGAGRVNQPGMVQLEHPDPRGVGERGHVGAGVGQPPARQLPQVASPGRTVKFYP